MKRKLYGAKRFASALLSAMLLLSVLPINILAADGARSATDNVIVNGSFEQPEFPNSSAPQVGAGTVDGWSTTASDQLIEFGSARMNGTVPHIKGSPNIPDGYQFAELNAKEESTLYQYTKTVGGNVYEWGLSHRGREGLDRMALIIGPKQTVEPAKTSKDGKDQFMLMTDWVKNNAAQMGVSIPNIGCSQKVTVYSKPFAENGGFANNADNVPFSKSPSNVYTQEWNVWIIGTNNNAWGNYGTNDPAYAAESLAYSCRYAVPDGQSETVFAFCAYSAAGGKTVGNLLDAVSFELFQRLSIRASGGKGELSISADDKDYTYRVENGKSQEALAANGSTVTVRAEEPDADTTFVGAYVTYQNLNGTLTREFIAAKDWTKVSDRVYRYDHKVETPAEISLIFVKSPTVLYDPNGGDKYYYEDGVDEPTNIVSFAENTGRTDYTSHAASSSKDGWQFAGWLLARNGVLLPAAHTVTYDKGTNTLTFSGNGTDISTGAAMSSTSVTGGATLVAQWKWRQRFITQVQNGSSFENNSDCGQVTVVGSSANENDIATDYYADTGERVSATAAANDGYCFIGWYQQIDNGTYQLVSTEATHRYTVEREGVQTVYARFARTHQVTYRWTSEEGKCPPNEPELPAAGTVIDGGSYPISQMYVANQTTVQGTGSVDGKSDVPGEWVFSGWRDGESSDVIRLTELINVTTDRVLYGRWTFVPNAQYELRYQSAGENCWTPSGLAQPPQAEMHYRAEKVTAAQSPAYTDGSLFVNDSETLKGTWRFDDWKRSDTNETVAANAQFDMPGNDLTLTGQWTFTPKTYTVVYDLNGGSGTAPEGHTSYDYTALRSRSGCEEKTGIPFGVSVELREFTGKAPEGKYFAGWGLSNDAQQTQQPGDSVNEETLGVSQDGQPVTLYAIYKPLETITVEFTVNNPSWGTVTTHSGTFYVDQGRTGITGAAVTSLAEAAAGFHFTGWVKENGGSAGTNAELTVSAVDLNVEQAGSVVRYIAQFAPNAFTVQFNANGGSGKMENQTFRTPERDEETARYLNKNAFTRKGYSFAGWAEYEDGAMAYRDGALFEGVVTYQGRPIENGATITLYARWVELPAVTVTYTAYPQQLGEVALNSDISQETAVQAAGVSESTNPETGTLLGATATPHAGSVFDGWYNDATRQKVSEELRFVPPRVNGRYESASYIAYFHAERYTLHYDANGGTGTMADQSFSHGDAQALTSCAFSRDGYSFVGWARKKTAQQADYVDQARLFFETAFPEGTKEATLYAVWKENTVTLSYVSADETLGTVSLASEDILAASGEKALGSTAQPKNGCTFDGWYSESGTLLSRELTYVPAKDGSVWRSSTYTARFSRVPTAPSKPAEPKQDTVTLAPIPQILNGDDHYAYLVGYEDGTVRPEGDITRAEVASVLFRLLQETERVQNLTRSNGYSDVPDSAWYCTAVSTLSKMGILQGYPDGTFRPDAGVTRAEFAAMIARFDSAAKATETPFQDIAGHWASDEIARAYGNGWITGYEDGKSGEHYFRPENHITRAETATLLNRVLHRLPEKESDLLANQIVWPDNPKTFWGYLAMQEATNSHEYERKTDGVHETQTAKRENRDWSKEFEQ